MTTKTTEVRCIGCKALLAKADDTGLIIKRGALEVAISGDFHASLVCDRPHCRRLNVVRLSTSTRAAPAAT